MTTGLVQTLWIPGPLATWNDAIDAAKGCGGTGANYVRLKRNETEKCEMHARAARLKPVQRAFLRFVWHEPNRQRDPDNVASAKKWVLDGLVHANVLPNDGWRGVAGFSDQVALATGCGVMVTIIETA